VDYGYEQCTSIGIAVLTAGLADESRQGGVDVMHAYLDDGVRAAVAWIGLYRVADLLLADLAHVTGMKPAEPLRFPRSRADVLYAATR
jgi:hypothetical protein